MRTKYSHLSNRELALLLQDQIDSGQPVPPEMSNEILNRLNRRGGDYHES